MRAQSSGEGGIFESGPTLIVIERRSIPGEIGFDDVEISVQIIVCGRDSHPRLRFAIGAQRTSRFNGDVLEFAILLVLVKRAGGGIVGDINIWPAAVVEVRGEHA